MPRPVHTSLFDLALAARMPALRPESPARSDGAARLEGKGGGTSALDHSAQDHQWRNFAVADHLGLASHPRLLALRRGDPTQDARARLGDADPTLALRDRLARFLRLSQAVTFASPADAIRQTLRTLLRPRDHVIVDAGSNSAMFETVLVSNARLLRSPPGSFQGVERRLHRLARMHHGGRVWVSVPAVSARASVMADLADLAALCQHYGAGLIVDVSQDLGTMAQGGGGVMELQGCAGRADIVLGGFDRAFAAQGGFAAFRDLDLWRSTGLKDKAQPCATEASAILAALDLIDSAEGRRRRLRLHATGLRLRNHLMSDGIAVLGQPSPVVPVRLSPDSVAERSALLAAAGFRVPLLRAPVVAGHAPRLQLHLTADHGPADIDDLADLLRDVLRQRARPAYPLTDAVT